MPIGLQYYVWCMLNIGVYVQHYIEVMASELKEMQM